FGAGIVLLIYSLMRILDFNNRISLAAALFLCIIPEFAFWSIGGLETTMYIFWLLAGIYSYIYERKYNRYHVLSVIFLFLLSITRPEGLYIAGAVILYHLVHAFRIKKHDVVTAKNAFHKILPGIIIFTVLYGTYFTWRYTTYGYFFPNTYYAKKVATVRQLFIRTQQIGVFIGPLLPFFAIAVFGFFQFNKKMTYEKKLLGILLLMLLAFCWLARFEWMPGHRYELPFTPLLMIFFAAGLPKILFNDLNKWKVRMSTRFVPLIVLVFFGVFMLSRFNDLRKKGNDFAGQLNRAHVQLGKWFKANVPASSSYASWDMGAVPYFSGMNTIIDINLEGLLNPYTAHHGYDIDRLLALQPDFLVLPPNTSYVKPRDILDFYTNPRLKENYDYLFPVYFDRDYILHVYKHKNVNLTNAAMQNANNITASSHREVSY
ncbi:MAG: hypothetical protein J7497_14525, partial [Chitinophagaceae bacterium]|nr:hypothetical protein [Chitinophagaceae bacterium]